MMKYNKPNKIQAMDIQTLIKNIKNVTEKTKRNEWRSTKKGLPGAVPSFLNEPNLEDIYGAICRSPHFDVVELTSRELFYIISRTDNEERKIGLELTNKFLEENKNNSNWFFFVKNIIKEDV